LSGSNREGVIAFRVGASEFSFRIFDCSGIPLGHLPTSSQSDVAQTSMRHVARYAIMPDCRSLRFCAAVLSSQRALIQFAIPGAAGVLFNEFS
jgi:hypothetical protein